MSAVLTPQPAVWPECPTCLAPFVLRRLMYLNGQEKWAWQRDCKHNDEPNIIGAENAEMP